MDFTHWQPGQGASTHSLAEKDALVTIKTQEEALLKKAGLVLNTGYEY